MSALRTGRAPLSRNIIFLLLILISVKGWVNSTLAGLTPAKSPWYAFNQRLGSTDPLEGTEVSFPEAFNFVLVNLKLACAWPLSAQCSLNTDVHIFAGWCVTCVLFYMPSYMIVAFFFHYTVCWMYPYRLQIKWGVKKGDVMQQGHRSSLSQCSGITVNIWRTSHRRRSSVSWTETRVTTGHQTTS
jgi:hypothetical protein